MPESVSYPTDASGNAINPRLLAAMAALKATPSRATGQEFYQALRSAMLILPEHGALDSRVGPVFSVTTERQQLSVRMLDLPDGTRVLPAFTDIEHVQARYPAGTLVTALPAGVIAQFVMADPQCNLVINPRSDPKPSSFVPRQLIGWIAQGVAELP